MEDDLFNIIISLGGGFYVVVGYGQKLPFYVIILCSSWGKRANVCQRLVFPC
jgi:hypothetical protein